MPCVYRNNANMPEKEAVGAMNELVGAFSISHQMKGYCYFLVFVLALIFYYVVILSRG